MKLVMTLLVRDEESILRENLWYHFRQGVDFVIATDNGSVDGSRAILEEYRRRGCLQIVEEPGRDYSQWLWVTRMARRAYDEHQADWVINNDADEFWWPAEGDLKTALGAVPPAYGLLKVPRVNFLPTAAESTWFIDRLVYRPAAPVNDLGRPLLGKICHRGAGDIEVRQGNHSAVSPSLGGTLEAPLVTVLHFPFRSLEQTCRSVGKGGKAYERNRDLPESVGKVKRHLYHLLKTGELDSYYRSLVPDPADLENRSIVEDDRLRGFFRQHGFLRTGERDAADGGARRRGLPP